MTTLRPYQQDAVEHAHAWAREALALPASCDPRLRRALYVSPTGTGKGTMQLALLDRLRAGGVDAWIATPSIEVLRGYLERRGVEPGHAGTDALADAGLQIYVTTPTRLRNAVARGEARLPEAILLDEAHHAIPDAVVSGDLLTWAPLSAWLGWTATPYRGTPRGTAALHEAWPTQFELLSLADACAQGWWALPYFSVAPLLDDDQIKVRGGEIDATSAGKALTGDERLAALAMLVRERSGSYPLSGRVVAMPSRSSAARLVEALDALGEPAALLTGATSARERGRLYAECQAGRVTVVQVAVLGEGVDLPGLRLLVDARPTLSPVAWLQLLGRLTRPGPRPTYVTVCRNLERHSYLLAGILPRAVVAEAQQAFEGPSKRTAHRSLELEALGRHKAIPLPLRGGLQGVMHVVYSVDATSGLTTEWCVLTSPDREEAITARRDVPRLVDGSADYSRAKWARAPLPADLTGYATSRWRGQPTDKQRAWWDRASRARGLDASAKITSRQIAALAVLCDLGEVL